MQNSLQIQMTKQHNKNDDSKCNENKCNENEN